MNFDKDIYISYAHIDDQPMGEGKQGWINDFSKFLEVRLQQIIGDQIVIWRDNKLTGNDFFTHEIESQFPKIKIMICIVTPRYAKSEWCNREVDLFFKAAEQTGGVVIENKSRIFKIMKTPVSVEDQPEHLRNILSYEFYKTDLETGRVTEYGLFEKDVEYWNKLNDVAYDIADLIEKINKNSHPMSIS